MATPEQIARATKLAEEQERYARAVRDAKDAQQELEQLLGTAVPPAQQATEIANKQAEIAQERLAIETKLQNIETARNNALTERSNIQEEIKQKITDMEAMTAPAIADAQKQLEVLKEKLAAARDNEQLLRDQADAQRDSERSLNRQERILKRNLKLQEDFGDEIVKNLEDAEKRANSFGQIFSDLAGDIPVIGSSITKMLNMFEKTPATLDRIAKAGANMGGTLGPAIQGAAEGMSSFLSGIPKPALVANLAVLALAAVAAKVALNIDNLSKEIGKATGFGNKFTHTIKAMGVEGNLMGIGFKESAAALKALTGGLSSFNPNAAKTNKHVGLTVAKLEQLGVSSAASVKSIDHMQRAMGLSAEKAADMTAQIARMGKEIGISGTKMIEDFNAASGRLAIYGNQNIKVFKQLAAQAKATGIAMQSLLNISQKFDQFDTAADSAAKLNAVLGTQLSTIEMMNATDSERIMILKQEVQASVGNFDSLDKFTKQYIQQAMGVASVDEAQRLLNMSTAEYQKYQDGQKESADIQKELADASAEMVPIMQQLKLAAMQFFMAFAPIVEQIAKFLSLMTPVIGVIGTAAKGLAFMATAWASVTLVTYAATGALSTFVSVAMATGIPQLILLVTALSYGLGKLYEILTMPGSKPMSQGMFSDIGDSIAKMGRLMANPIKMVSFDISAMAKMDTTKIASGFNEIKSAVMDLSNIEIDGFLAMKTDGSSSSFVMGSDGLIKSISEGKLTVDVKIPDMKMPDISVKVYIGDRELRDIIRTEAKAVVGRAG